MTRRGLDGEGRSGEMKMAASFRSEQASPGGATGAAEALEEGAALGGAAGEACELAAGGLEVIGGGEGSSLHAARRAAASAATHDLRGERGMS